MTKEKHYEITIHLETIHDLFITPRENPFSENAHYISGIEIIKSNLRLARRSARARTTILLPKTNIEPDLVEKTREALSRYCQFKIQQNKDVMAINRGEALRALLIGVVFLTGGLFVSDKLGFVMFLPDFLRTLFSNGFDIAFWVILWRPVDFFLFDLSAYRQVEQIYKQIMQMEIVISAER